MPPNAFFTEQERSRMFYPNRYYRMMNLLLTAGSDSKLECHVNTRLTKAAVTRGDYRAVFQLIVLGLGRLFSITGPTGCGKSTFALLELLLGATVLVICPSPANLANQLVEFLSRIPDTSIRHNLQALIPTVAACDFNTFCDPDAQLTVCTAEQFNSFVALNGFYPPVDYLVLDEYHLNSPPVIRARMLLQHAFPPTRSPQNKQKVVFVSATPPDEEPPPVRTDGLTVVPMTIPEPLIEPTPDIYRLSKHPPYSNQVMLIVADSCAAAHDLKLRLEELGEDCYCLCKCPTPEDVADSLQRNNRKFTFIATPDTEAGITVPCSIMVNPGLAARVDFRQGVLAPDVFPLGPRQSNQRLGRAGRLGHTIVYTANTEYGQTDTASLVELAAAYLNVLALTGGHPRGLEPDLAAERFTRITQVNVRAARRAMIAVSPMLALYRADNEGYRYKEFGGNASGFVQQNARDFKLFKWPNGSAYAPFLDLCSEHDLTEGNNPRLQKAIADSIVELNPHVMENVTMESAITAAASKPELYAEAIWGAMKELSGAPGTVNGVDLAAELDFSAVAITGLEYMLTPIGAKAWAVLANLGGKYEYWAIPTGATNKEGTKNVFELHRTFSYRGVTVTFSPKDLLGSDRLVDPKRLEAIFLPFLTPIMATNALLDRPEHSIDIMSFAHIKNRSSNTWFKSVI